MAKIHALIKFNDNTIKHIIWNASSDHCLPKIYETFEETDNNWDVDHFDEYIVNKCKHTEEDIIIFNGYSYWKGKGCRKCNFIIDKTSYDKLDNLDEQIFEVPSWVKEYCNEHDIECIL